MGTSRAGERTDIYRECSVVHRQANRFEQRIEIGKELVLIVFLQRLDRFHGSPWFSQLAASSFRDFYNLYIRWRDKLLSSEPYDALRTVFSRESEVADLHVTMFHVGLLDPEGWIFPRLSFDSLYRKILRIDPDLSP